MTENDDLAERVARIVQLEEAAAEAAADVKAAYDAAASAGYTKSAMKKAIRIHKLSPDKRKANESEQLDIELYLARIDGKEEAVAEAEYALAELRGITQ